MKTEEFTTCPECFKELMFVGGNSVRCSSCGRGFWFCECCEKYHHYFQEHCDLPCVQMNQDTKLEDYFKDRNGKDFAFFDPEQYAHFDEDTGVHGDDAHLNFSHTKLYRWLGNAETIWNRKLKLSLYPVKLACYLLKMSKININDVRLPMNEFERALRLQEIRRFGWSSELKKFGYKKAITDKGYGKILGLPEQWEVFWDREIKNARAILGLVVIEDEYNHKLKNGEEPLFTIGQLYHMAKINITDTKKQQNAFEKALRRQELSKLSPEKNGKPLPEERFWSWAIGYGTQEAERKGAMRGVPQLSIEHKLIPERYENSFGKRYT